MTEQVAAIIERCENLSRSDLDTIISVWKERGEGADVYALKALETADEERKAEASRVRQAMTRAMERHIPYVGLNYVFLAKAGSELALAIATHDLLGQGWYMQCDYDRLVAPFRAVMDGV